MPTHRLITGSLSALELALAAELRAAKSADSLAPVTVLVGETVLRPYLRRRLADHIGGHLNLHILTAGDLGLVVGQHALMAQAREPLPFLGDRIIAQQVSRAASGYFAPVADMPGFAGAVFRTLHELRQARLTPGALRDAAGRSHTPEKLRDLADLYEAFERDRGSFFAPDDGLLHADPARLPGDRLLVYGLWQPSARLKAALIAIAARLPITVLLPEAAGDAGAVLDPFRDWLQRQLDVTTAAAVEPAREPHDTDHVRRHLFTAPAAAALDGSVRLLSAPDPAREVKEALRAVLRWADEGIPFHQIAVTYRHGDRYRSLIESAFREARVPIYLHEGTPLSERPLGRRSLALLDLAAGGLERSAVMAFLADARLPQETWERYGRVSAARWDAISREAGIVEGIDQWRDRLAGLATSLAARYDGERPGWVDERLAAIRHLRDFVSDLHSRLQATPAEATWSAHLAHFRDLFATYESEGEPLLDALDGLARLDPLDRPIGASRFREVVAGFIDGLRASDVLDARAGALGLRGVQVLDVNTIRHLGHRAVVVLGLSERAFPPPPRQDALLLDEERIELNEATGAELPLRALGEDPEPLQFALTVAGARERLQLSFARTEQGAQRALLPSSFFRAAAEALVGHPVAADKVDGLPSSIYTRVRAGRLGAERVEEALDRVEYERTLLELRPDLGAGVLTARRPAYGRAVAAERARWSPDLTPYDGVLGEAGAAALADHWSLKLPFSPSRLETYSRCPYQFFLATVLRLKAIEEPEATARISALDRGDVFHRILERFMAEHVDDPPSEARRNVHLPHLMAIADEELKRAEDAGLTGYALLWRLDRAVIVDDVRLWYEHEARDPQNQSLTQGAFEVRFGAAWHGEGPGGPLTTDEPLVLEAAGTELRIAGRIDRVNWSEGQFRVIDYKTGKARAKSGALGGGEALQLPIYLLAAARALRMEPKAGSAEYFYATRTGGFRRAVFSGQDLVDRREDFDRVLREVAGAIRAGDFHAQPGRHCDWCSFQTICDARRNAIRRVKGADPRVVEFAARKEDVK